MSTLRALPTLFRIGVAETVAYRSEFLVWILTTTQPLVMMGLFTSVARDEAFHGYSSSAFVAYYLATLIVRQMTGNWVAWQMMEDVRTGSMAMRLLRPIHPFFAYAASHVAAVPFRSVVALPLAIVLLAGSGASALTSHPLQIALFIPSLALAWVVTFLTWFAIGSLAFFITQTFGVVNLYYGLFAVFSGYLVPLEMMPGPIRGAARYLPFRCMLSTPVELLTKSLDRDQIVDLLGGQLVWLAILALIARSIWNAGVRRFESVGG